MNSTELLHTTLTMEAKRYGKYTDEEIAALANVPVKVAAEYLGWSIPSMYYCLQNGLFPPTVGMTAKHSTGKRDKYSYWISGAALVKFRRGEMPDEAHITVVRRD